jgi:hypothetical protein
MILEGLWKGQRELANLSREVGHARTLQPR